MGAHLAELVGGELAGGDVDKHAVSAGDQGSAFWLVIRGNHPGIEAEGDCHVDKTVDDLDRRMRRWRQAGRTQTGE